MPKYIVYRDNLGTATARPVVGGFSCDASDLSLHVAQLEPNEVAREVADSFGVEDQASETLTNRYTVDPASPPTGIVTPVAVSTNRLTLEQKQWRHLRRKRERLQQAREQLVSGLRYSDTRHQDWITYFRNVRALADAPADPDTVSWPTLPSFTEDETVEMFARQYRRSNVIGTVGLSGSIPTGAVIETGTNANGMYIRTADGGQICRARIAAGFFNSTRMAVNWTLPADFSSAVWTFQATFSTHNNANVADGLADTVIRQCQVMCQAKTASSVAIHVLSPTYTFVAGNTVWLDIFSMGRWAA